MVGLSAQRRTLLHLSQNHDDDDCRKKCEALHLVNPLRKLARSKNIETILLSLFFFAVLVAFKG